MRRPDRVHDRAILDALESMGQTPFEGEVWRVTRKGRHAATGTTADGRWSPPGEFEVLYTSIERKGALAEARYRLSLEPIWPSRIEHVIHRLGVSLERALRLADLSQLAPMGVDTAHYENFDYAATHAIASGAHFLDFDGLIVPSARYSGANVVIFIDRLGPGHRIEVKESNLVDLSAWRRRS